MNKPNKPETDLIKEESVETQEIDYYERFRSNLGLNKIAGLPDRVGYTRKGVITNYPASAGLELVRNFDNHVKMGYRLVLSTESIQDDRKFSPNTNSRPNTVPAPIVGRTSDGFDYVVMEIENTKLTEEMKKRNKEEYEKYLASVRGKVVRKDGEIQIKDEETKF